jgi:hypothetical protein
MTEKKLNVKELARMRINIPKGFFYVTGTPSTGVVIQNDAGDQYVLVPEGPTTEGHHVENIWVSRYEISKGDDGIPMSVAGKFPWSNVSYNEAAEAADKIGGHLPSKDEYARICTWLVREEVVDFHEMYFDGRANGNYAREKALVKTGSCQSWQHNHIFDFFGNGYTWTTEKFAMDQMKRVIRGGHYIGHSDAVSYPPMNFGFMKPSERSELVTFRVVLKFDEDSEEED